MIHIIPIDDLKEHITESTCECRPEVIRQNESLICIHNSFDGREYKEQLIDAITKN